MDYAIWKDGTQIGQTDLEMKVDGRRRAGIFRPTQQGVTVLPGICAMLPALMAFGEMCRRRGIKTEEYSSGDKPFPFEEFVDTPEGRAVTEAAKHFAGIELRDARGQTVGWEVLTISDVAEIQTLARELAITVPEETPRRAESMYIISVTFARRLRSRLERPGPRDTPFAVC